MPTMIPLAGLCVNWSRTNRSCGSDVGDIARRADLRVVRRWARSRMRSRRRCAAQSATSSCAAISLTSEAMMRWAGPFGKRPGTANSSRSGTDSMRRRNLRRSRASRHRSLASSASLRRHWAGSARRYPRQASSRPITAAARRRCRRAASLRSRIGFAAGSDMTAIMSFSNAPDEDRLGRVAGALAVDEAFVEKDWYVIQAIGRLSEMATDNFVLVFSGGTSLLKGYDLIRRFSEDIDFKLSLAEGFLDLSRNQRKNALKTFRE